MEELFNINLKKTSLFSKEDEIHREKNLKLFLESGFPNKKDENWKFTDLNSIIKKILRISQMIIILILRKKDSVNQ